MTLRIRPSGSKVWLACPLGLTMQTLYGDRYPSGAAADEGTAAHWVKEHLREGVILTPGDVAPNGVAVDADMLHYGAEANAYIDRFAQGGEVFTERYLTMRIPGYEIRGTTDDLATVAIDAERTLHIFDYKYGHVFVEATAPQLKCYGVAAVQEFNIERVVLHIIQPRAYGHKPYRSYHFTPAAQNEFCDEVANALRLAHAAKPYAVAGTHCLRCPGRGPCGTRRAATMEFAERCATEMISPEALSEELKIAQMAVDLATAGLRGLQDEATHVLSGGGVVPGWALERKPGRQQWKASDEAHVLALADAFGVGDAVSKRVLITPLQAQKAGLPAELVKLHTERPVGEPKLVPAADTLASQVFSTGA